MAYSVTRSRASLPRGTVLLICCLLLVLAVPGVYGQSPTAALNSPTSSVVTETKTVSAPTSTVTAGTTQGASAPLPTQTSVAPLALSSQQVPYLLSLPQKSAEDGVWRGPTFTGCSEDTTVNYADPPFRINVSSVYTQYDTNTAEENLQDGRHATLRIVAVGSVGNESHAFANSVGTNGATLGLLSAAGAQTRFLSFDVFERYTFLCDRLFPIANDSVNPRVNPPSCQYGPGMVAFGFSIPLNSSYTAGTLWTQLRLTDPSNPARTLTCIEVQASPYEPNSWYWRFTLWVPVALFTAFFLLATAAALTTSVTTRRMAYKNRAREGGPPTFVRDTLRPTILSALAGREMVRSPSLLRFVTPGCWDVLLHLQFLVAVAMCHVGWPDFVYPFARQIAWSALLGNVTIVEKAGQSHSLLATNASLPTGDIGTQMGVATSPLYMNSAQSNKLLNLGTAEIGMNRYAAAVGLSSSSFFGTCLSIWLAIVAGLLIVSAVAYLVDVLFESEYERKRKKELASGDIVLPASSGQSVAESKVKSGRESSIAPLMGTDNSGTGYPGRAAGVSRLGRARKGHHFVALHGNLLRALVLFHLPITIVNVYQFASPTGHSATSVALAALSFAAFSVAAPVYIISRIARATTERLYEDGPTLLALGPVYHMYAPGSQLYYTVSFVHSLALGLAVGAGQRSGAAQSVVILVVEVLAALASSLWLPWGDGAMMGPLNFMTGVLRIITAVLVLLLSSLTGFGNQARGWLTYVILLIQAIFFGGAVLIVLLKLVEALVRVIWRVRFDERVSGRTGGLGGAVRRIKRRKQKNRKATAVGAVPLQMRAVRPGQHSRNTSMASATTMRMFEKRGVTPMNEGGHHPRLSYSDYLDYGVAGKQRPPSGGSDFDYFGRGAYDKPGRPAGYSPGNPFAPGNINDESGAIMAALPAVTPGSVGIDERNAAGGRMSQPFRYAPPGMHVPSDGTLPSHARSRSQSAAGMMSGAERGMQTRSQPLMDSNYARSMAERGMPHDMSSTQAAAQAAARQSLAGFDAHSSRNGYALPPQQPVPAAFAREGLLGGLRRKFQKGGRSGGINTFDDDDDDDDTWDQEGGTWNSRTAADNRVPWTGAVKISSAIQSFFGNRGTASGATKGQPVPVKTEDEEPTAAKGFEVVRKPRPGAGPARASQPDLLNEPQEQLTHGVAQPPHERVASDFYSDVTPVDRSTNTSAKSRPGSSFGMTPLDLNQGSLGLLGADLQRGTSSAGHTAHDDAGEERFWLPPLALGTDTDGHQDQHAEQGR